MIRRLPDGFPLLLRGGYAPVIVAVAKGWKHPEYRRLRRGGLHVVASADERDELLITSAVPEPSFVPGPLAEGRPSWPPAHGDGTA
jgi:hypothetical protein